MGVNVASAVLIMGGYYALQLRDARAPRYPNTWGLFGGGIEPGESSYAAIIREIREELELEVQPQHLLDLDTVRIFVADVTRQWWEHVLHEGVAVGLFTFAETRDLGLNRITAAALAAAREAR